jgi:drug/metabolite transporter (DMT)-like permease
MAKKNIYLGFILAFFAALFNGMVGIFSVKIMSYGLHPITVVFYKCLIGVVVITSWLILSNQIKAWLTYLKQHYLKIAVCTFCGFFMACYFETNAYNYIKVPVAVFLLLGSSTITTFILSAILYRQRIKNYQFFACGIALFGLSLIFGTHGIQINNANFFGIFSAVLAGVGYGMFLSFSSKFKLGSGLIVLNSLFLFATIYLSVPFVFQGFQVVPNMYSFILLLALTLLPTIGGLWCTMHALVLLKSDTVQLIELSEPLFALLFSYILLQQQLAYVQLIGGMCIIIAIYINSFGWKLPDVSAPSKSS